MQCLLEIRRHGRGAFEQAFLAVHIDGGARSGGGYRVAGVSIAMEQFDRTLRPLHERLMDTVVRDYATHRNGAVGDTLGEAHEVGHDAEIFCGESFAQAAETGDHLVEYEQDAILVADRAQALEIALGRYQSAGGAGHRLDDHRRYVGSVVQRDDAVLQFVGEMRAPLGLAARIGLPG